jgi:hypothetical protein
MVTKRKDPNCYSAFSPARRKSQPSNSVSADLREFPRIDNEDRQHLQTMEFEMRS